MKGLKTSWMHWFFVMVLAVAASACGDSDGAQQSPVDEDGSDGSATGGTDAGDGGVTGGAPTGGMPTGGMPTGGDVMGGVTGGAMGPCMDDTTGPSIVMAPESPLMVGLNEQTVNVTLVFDEPITALTTDDFIVTDGLNVTVSATDERGASVTVSGLTNGLTGTVTLPAMNVSDVCMNTSADDFVLEIVVEAEPDTEAPSVIATTPVDMATMVGGAAPLEVQFSEPMDQAVGTFTIEAGGTMLSATASWNMTGDTLTLTPDSPLPLMAMISVTLQDYQDVAGNVLPMPFSWTFTTAEDPCAGLPGMVTVDATPQGPSQTGGIIAVAVRFSSAFPLQESDLTVSPVGTAAGNLQAGSLQAINTQEYTFNIENAIGGDRYFVTAASGVTPDGCTTFAGLTSPGIIVTVRAIPNMVGMCPLPQAAPQNFTSPKMCDGGEVNGDLGTSAGTGFTLSNPGDVFSISGTYDGDPTDNEQFFSFGVAESGANLTELSVTFAYGCTYSGSATAPTSTSEIEIRDNTGALINVVGGGSVMPGSGPHNTISGSGSFGFAGGSVQLNGPAGINTYHVVLDDTNTSAWCMDFVTWVELIDNTKPASCLGVSSQTNIVNTAPVTLGVLAGVVDVTLEFDGPFMLQASHVVVTPTSGGAGVLDPASLTSSAGDTQWRFQVTGAAIGETYDVGVIMASDACTTLQATTIAVTLVDGQCLGAQPTTALNTTGQTVIFDGTANTAQVQVIFNEPYVLQEADIAVAPVTAGMGSVTPGSLRRTGPPTAPGRTHAFELQNVNVGEQYTITITGGTDTCMTTLTGGSYVVTVTNVPQAQGTCPIPALNTNFMAPDACGAPPTNNIISAGFPTGTLNAPGDTFSITGTYDSDGSDFDFFSFQVNETGTTISEVRIGFAYGCNFTNGGTPGAFGGDIDLYAGTMTASPSIISFGGTPNFDVVNNSGSFGFGADIAQLTGAAGLNTYSVRVDDVGGSTWCMDYALYVEYLNNTLPLSCLGVPGTITVDATPQQLGVFGGVATVTFTLNAAFTLMETDLSLMGSGAGSIVPGTLMTTDNINYTIDIAGVAQMENYSLMFTSRNDMCSTLQAGSIPLSVVSGPCLGSGGVGTNANVQTTPQTTVIDTMTNTAPVTVIFDTPFDLQEADINVVATTGSGFLTPGSLQRTGPMGQTGLTHQFELQGVAVGDSYAVTVTGRTDQCGVAAMTATVSVGITNVPQAQGTCPIPVLTQNFTAPDACTVPTTNGDQATSAPTGLTLNAPGDTFSVSGTYDSSGSPSDFDYFEFNVVETGTTIAELSVGFAYGCNFTNGGSPGLTTTPAAWLEAEGSGTRIGQFNGGQGFGAVQGSGSYGFGSNTFQLTGAMGSNIYHVAVDDIGGSVWCMDFAVYVEYLDNTKPLSCLGVPGTVTVGATPQQLGEVAGAVTVNFTTSSSFMLQETDLTLTGMGAGVITPGSLTTSNNIDFSLNLVGVAPGDTYSLNFATRTDMCTTLQAGSIPLTIVAGACLGSGGMGTTAVLQTSTQTALIDAMTNTATVPVVFDTPFDLAEADISITPTSMGAVGFLAPGSLLRTGPVTEPARTHQFVLSSVAIGETYDVTVTGRTDQCGVAVMSTTFPVIISQTPSMQGSCPIPLLTQNFTAPDACTATTTNGNQATSASTGFTLTNPGDAFSVSGIYDSSGSPGDFDYFAFDVVESGTTITDVSVGFAYGCSFTNGGTPSTSDAPAAWLEADGDTTRIGQFNGGQNFGAVQGSGSFGFGSNTFQLTGAMGTNTYHLAIDDINGVTWCMDFAVYVEMTNNTAPAACLGVTSTTSTVVSTMQTGLRDNVSGNTPVQITFTDPYAPQESDIMISSLMGSGGGFLVPGTLSSVSQSVWEFQLGGALPNDSYSITVNGGTPDLCGTTLTTGSFTLDVIDVRCNGAQMSAMLQTGGRDVIFDPMAAVASAIVPVTFDTPFALEAPDVSILPTNGGGGFIIPRTLVRVNNTLYTFEVQGISNGDTYQVNIAGRTDICGTTLAMGSFNITITDSYPSTPGGVCPLPTLPNNFAAPEVCTGPALHNTPTSAAASGITLANPGDTLSISGTHTAGNFNFDYTSFQIDQAAGNINEIRVTVGYGCMLGGPGMPTTTSSGEVDLLDASGGFIDSFTGDLSGNALTGTTYGFGTQTFQLTGAAGPTTYILGFQVFEFNTTWCADYVLYVELIDNTKPASCLGTPGVITPNTSGQTLGEVGGQVTVNLDLNGQFPLVETDFIITPTSGGAGAYVPGSLTSTNNTNWTFEMVGVVPGETYSVDLMSRLDVCSTLQASSVPLSIIDGRCIGAGATATLQTNGQAAIVDAMAMTATVPVAFDAPFFLQGADLVVTPVTPGAVGFLIPGSLTRTGPASAPGQRFTFDMGSVVVGEQYSITIAGRTDICMTALTGGMYTVTMSSVPGMQGACPIPALSTNFQAPDACAAGPTNNTQATAAPSGTLTNVGDAFSITGDYYSSGSDFDFWTFSVAMNGMSTYDVRVSLAYGCNFTNGGTPGADAPDIDLYEGTTSTANTLFTFLGGQNYNTVNGSGSYGFGSDTAALTGPAGTNGYTLRLDDVNGATWCMDFAIYVELIGITP